MRSKNENGTTSSSKPVAPGVTRRSVLKGSTAAIGGAATFAALGTNFAWAQVSEEIKVGMIGAGGRASGAAGNILEAAGIIKQGVKIHAVADAFPDPVKKIQEKYKVEKKNAFVGLDAYKELVNSDIELVITYGGRQYYVDLLNNADDTKSPGLSFECFGTFSVAQGLLPVSEKKTEARVNAFVLYQTPDKTGFPIGTKPGASRIFLLHDADDAAGKPGAIENFPDKTDNHGAAGANFTFCDGHAQWVKQKYYDSVLNASQNGNQQNGPIIPLP